jgi:Ni2+-binding GTPase involved in maturation of urease and hydrogenase
MRVPLLIVGGFLGAGKTTLLWQAARRLSARGLRVGLVTNDQAADLVDTGLLATRGFDVREVSGSCFCCDFPALIAQAEALKEGLGADILLAEPVGSCTDLSATVLQPLKDRYAGEFRLGRLSVLVDPERLAAALDGRLTDGLHPSAAYVLRKQLEEADLILVNKTDALTAAETAALRARVEAGFPGQEVRLISALEDVGVEEWLAAAQGEGSVGSRILDVDYDTYAEGEAVLGWLNARISLASAGRAADWGAFCASFMGSLRDALDARALPVGHVKMLLSSSEGHEVASLTRTAGSISSRGQVGRTGEADLVVNARVQTSPESLESIVRDALAAAAGSDVRVTIRTMRSLRPGRPIPTFRYAAAVG